MRWENMSSPTPSLESLSMGTCTNGFIDQIGSDHGSLELPGLGCHGSSSSSSTCSSIVFPHISIATGRSNGYCLGGSGGMNGDFSGLPSPNGCSGTKCGICHENFTHPKVLPCLHTFCGDCLEKASDGSDRVFCPSCRQECILGPSGVDGLLMDYAIENLSKEGSLCDGSEGVLDGKAGGVSSHNNNNNADNINNNVSGVGKTCTGCKSEDTYAVAECEECSNYLCSSCVNAHVFMRCFEGHHVNSLYPDQNGKNMGDLTGLEHHIFCTQHKEEVLQYFCRTCAVPICAECLEQNHPKPNHDYETLASCESKYVKQLSQYIHEFRVKSLGLHDVLKSFEGASSTLKSRYLKAQNEITDAFAFYRSLLDDRKSELLKELETLYGGRQLTLTVVTQRVQDTLDRMYQTVEFGDRLLRHASPPQILVFKKLLETRLQALLAAVPEPSIAVSMAAQGDLEFVASYSAIQTAVQNAPCYIKSGVGSDVGNAGKQQPAPIARPAAAQGNGLHVSQNGNKGMGGIHNGHPSLEASLLSKRLANNMTSAPYNNLDLGGLRTYETWSIGTDSMFQNGRKDYSGNGGNLDVFGTSPPSTQKSDPMLEIASKIMPPLVFPKGPAIKRQKMTYHYKFGEFGTAEAQFTEPSGVAVNANNEIIVADTNNHRIQIFDREGRFKFQFGECGKRDGQLLYPNRVAVVKTSGDIVVTERSPTHQIQIYTQYGQFVRKFGATILQHPRGVTVDNKGRVIVVECKVMRVIIFDQMGTVLHKFGCSKHLEFPNGVVVNDRQEIFISDNRAHCVKVFNYEGLFLRQIGGEGLTNYPIGVGINSNGEILVADNHNNFNLTIFTQEGQLVSALESKVKHAQCFDVALMEDGSVVLASKDYRLYIYRYVQMPPLGM